jgi:hypothetical protein
VQNTEIEKHLFEKLADLIKHRNCVNCIAWMHEKEWCNKYNLRPPARIIIKGCEYFEDADLIPF